MVQRSALTILLLLLLPSVAQSFDEAPTAGERAAYIRAHYTKFEYRIPMRDGKRLFTAVYSPNPAETRHPILLLRTPYSVEPYGADRYREKLGPYAEYEREGFIFVFQDVRGRFMSEGEYVNMRPHRAKRSGPRDIDESTDTWDTIEWLLENVENHNGKVGMWGISYPGFYCSAGMIDSHPALAAVSPQAPISDWYWDDMHHHGALILSLTFNFFSGFGRPRTGLTTEWPERFEHGTPDGYQFFLDLGPLGNVNERYFKGEIAFWNQIAEHPNYDAFWQARNILPHLKNIKAAVMTVGGWFDAEDLYGPLKTYRAVEQNNPEIFNVLVMGAWGHGGWTRTEGDRLGRAEFGFKTSEYYQRHVELPFFRHFLKGEGELDLPEALVFETGANRWRSFAAWPPENLDERRLFLGSGGRLADAAPDDDHGAHDAWVSDPAKPVPYSMEISTGYPKSYMTEDQRFAARRPDVMVYQSEVLEEDLTLAGPLQAELWVSTSGTDSDWVVKLIDVLPGEIPGFDADSGAVDLGGSQRLVRAEVFRGRFRESYEHPKPFVADQITPVSFELLDVLHTFKRGHRVMVQIQSTWFPLVDRNPQKYVPNIFEAKAEDFIKVTNRVFRCREHPSAIRLGVLR
ncbi:MAG: CocE/NonD family hydrolase [bacterium]|nr:CocE/NonD family hydrolase [bacterium]